MNNVLLINFMCVLLLISALMVVISKNPIHSILFLVISFLISSFILFLSENEFLAFFFLTIYLGAIAILFLFVVMMLNIKHSDLQTNKLYLPIGVFLGFTVFLEVCSGVSDTFSKNSIFNIFELNFYTNWYDNLDRFPDIAVLSQIFYTHYVLQLLMSGLILYLAVIGVSFLTIKSFQNKNTKYNQTIFRQLARKNNL